MNQRDDSTYELISAYLDGELSEDERARAEQLLQTSPSHQQMCQEIQSVGRALRALPAYHLDEVVSARVLAATEGRSQAHGRGGDGEGARAVRQPHEKQTRWRRWYFGLSVVAGAAAAVLVAFFSGDRPFQDAPREVNPKSLVRADRQEKNETPPDGAAGLPESHSVSAPAENSQVPAAGEKSLAAPKRLVHESGSEAAAEPGSLDLSDSGSDRGGSEPRPQTKRRATVASTTDSNSSKAGSARSGRRQSPPRNSTPKIAWSPGRNSQKLVFVVDVEMTRAGWNEGFFRRVLNQEGVAFATDLSVDSQLKKSLLRSRFFQPGSEVDSKASGSARDAPIILVYVAAQAKALDRAWQRMKQDQPHFTKVSLDLALQPAGLSVFGQLRQSGFDASADLENQGLRQSGIARRLDFPAAWNVAPTPGTGNEAVKPARETSEAFQPDRPKPEAEEVNSSVAGPFGESDYLLGSNVFVEALFVVQCAPADSE